MGKRTCKMPGCPNPHLARDLCGMHYARQRLTGDPGPAERYREVAPSECTVPGCPEIPKGHGLCEMHWARKRRTGSTGPAEKRPSRGTCQFPGCESPHVARGFCDLHYRRVLKHDDPGHVRQQWAGDDAGYTAVHVRLRKLRGDATEHACQQCASPADEWAYDHNDPDEHRDPKRGPYSTDPDRYMPLCTPCHRKMDRSPTRPWREAK